MKATDKRMEREAERETHTERDGLEREREKGGRDRKKKLTGTFQHGAH